MKNMAIHIMRCVVGACDETCRFYGCGDRCLMHDTDFGEISNWLEKAEKALEKADKYRWHDLRKNPDDLPKFNQTVLITFNGYGGRVFDLAMHSRTTHLWGTATASYKENDVIAWRELEMFEGCEKEEI